MFKGLEVPESQRIILLVARKGLPVAIGCILLPAIMAIIISTANSFLLVPATNISRDIYQRFINPDVPDKKMILYSRIFVIVLGIIAYSLINFFPRILDAAYAAYTVYGSGLTPALMAVFFWKRATARGGVVSISAGMIITIIWEIARKVMGGFPLGMPAVYPALVASVVLLIVVSLTDEKPSEEKWKPFFKE
jgi:Na+/proline symporter